jgi:ferredoxin-NADP reductase
MLTKHLSEEELLKSKYYVCGPPGMLTAMQDLLKNEMKIPKDRIKVEEFTGY